MEEAIKYNNTLVRLEFDRYSVNHRLALSLIDGAGCFYTCATVNLVDEELTNERCAFIDTNNNSEEIIEWLRKNNLGKFTGRVGFSGYCIYPEFEFYKGAIEKFKNYSFDH